MNELQRSQNKTNTKSSTYVVLSCIVLTLTFVTYLRALTFSFVYDDVFLLFNDFRLQSWEHWSKFFTEHLWSSLSERGNYYRPTILLWYLIQQSLFGFDPALWHFASVSLHVCVTALVHRLAVRILKDPLPAAAAALAFGLHPIHVESVAWISGSHDPLMTFFTLASFLCFLRWRDATTSDRGKTAPWLAGSLLLYALAQLTKETAIVFPAVVFGSAFFIDQRHGATWKSRLIGAFRAMAPYLLVAALYLVVRVSVLGRIADSISSAPLSELLFTLPGILLKYLQHLLFPVGLSPFYDTPYITSFSWASVGLPLTLIFFAGAGLICWSRRSIVVPIAIVWMIFPLLPVLNLSLLPEVERFHDRFLYLPSVGFVLLFGLAVSGLKNSGPRAFGFPVVRIVAAILVCGPLALGTVFQSSHWRDDVRLFRRASIIAPGNDNVLNNFSAQLIKSGRPDEAEVYLRRVIERSPNHALSLFNLGTVNVYRGEYAQAEHFLLLALETSNNPDIYINLGFVHWRMGRLEDAEKDFRAAISYSRNRPGYGKHLGVLLRHQGRLLEALEVFETELSIDPGQLDVRQQIEQLRARINTQ